MSEQVAAAVADGQVMSRDKAFWVGAHKRAETVTNRGGALSELMVQWTNLHPDATEEEQQIAVANLRSILRMDPV